MDPVSVGGLALGVASIGFQVYTGCLQGIQFLITALGYDEDTRYLNLRLRFEQQRLFAWSDASGLLDVEGKDHKRILDSNVFGLHRQTVLDLLMQIQCLFDEFTKHHRRHQNLLPVRDEEGILEAPEKDAQQAKFPLNEKNKNFLKRSMQSLKSKSQGNFQRLRWASFDKTGYETLLDRFSALNDKMANLLDHSMQLEIRNTVEDTNRGVLLLHHKIADLNQLVLALKSQLDARSATAESPISVREPHAL